MLGNYTDDTQNGLIYSYFKLSRPKHTIVMGWKLGKGEKWESDWANRRDEDEKEKRKKGQKTGTEEEGGR